MLILLHQRILLFHTLFNTLQDIDYNPALFLKLHQKIFIFNQQMLLKYQY